MTQLSPSVEEPPGGKALRVHPERCVHTRFEQAACTACVGACPTSAWQLDDDGLQLNTALCDDCGLCTAACPQEALSLHNPLLAAEVEGERQVLVACERSGVSAGAGVVACLHSLSVRALARLVAEGMSAIVTASGDCENCSRGAGERLERRLQGLTRVLRSRGSDEFKHHAHPASAWQALRQRVGQSTGHSPGHFLERRRFLRGGLRQITRLAYGVEEVDPQTEPRPVSALLGGGNRGIAEWRPRLDEETCDGCGACVRLCPTQALRLDDAQGHYEVVPDHCTGCRVCAEVCTNNAITQQPWDDATPYTVTLTPRRCRACGATYRLPKTRTDRDAFCPICGKTNHYRHLYQVLTG